MVKYVCKRNLSFSVLQMAKLSTLARLNNIGIIKISKVSTAFVNYFLMDTANVVCLKTQLI